MKYLQAIAKRILSSARIIKLGSSITDKFILLKATIRIKLDFYTHRTPKAFSAALKAGGNYARIYLIGLYDELEILQEVFVDKGYQNSIEPVHNILDLGANVGIATVWLALVHPNAAIHAYEPSKAPFNMLEKNTKGIKNVTLFLEAVAPTEGTLEMNESERSIESSLVFNFEHTKKVSVKAITLDTAVDRIGGHLDLLKIDIEGAEFDVLATSKKLNSIREIVGEVHPSFAKRSLDEFKASLSPTHNVKIWGEGGKSLAFHAILKNL